VLGGLEGLAQTNPSKLSVNRRNPGKLYADVGLRRVPKVKSDYEWSSLPFLATIVSSAYDFCNPNRRRRADER
jgi:hypothetical protein